MHAMLAVCKMSGDQNTTNDTLLPNKRVTGQKESESELNDGMNGMALFQDQKSIDQQGATTQRAYMPHPQPQDLTNIGFCATLDKEYHDFRLDLLS